MTFSSQRFSLATATSAALGLALLSGCATAPQKKIFGYVDKAGVEFPLALKSKKTIEMTDSGALTFGKTIQASAAKDSSSSWSCKIGVRVALKGDSSLFHRRLQEALVQKTGMSLDGVGTRFVKSSFGKRGTESKSFSFELDDLLGTYQLKRLGPEDLAFVNANGFFFSGLIDSEKDLQDLELTLELDSVASTEAFKNVMCAEVRDGVELRR